MTDTVTEINVLDDDAPATYPMVPIRDVVVFPSMMVPFVIGRASSVVALEMALRRDKKIYLATQKDASQDNPSPKDIYSVGTVANIVQSLKLPDGNIKVLVEGVRRARTVEVHEMEDYFQAQVRFEAVPTGEHNFYGLSLTIDRLSGDRASWRRANQGFVNGLRKQFLIWRTVAPEDRETFKEKGLKMLGRAAEKTSA